jgi:hypothetical protein
MEQPMFVFTLRHDLSMLEVLLGTDPPLPVRRARLMIQGGAVLLDGQSVPLDMTTEARGEALCLLTHLLAAQGDWRSSTELNDMESAGPCKEHVGARWDRTRKKLPRCLFSLIESNHRKGYRLSPTVFK